MASVMLTWQDLHSKMWRSASPPLRPIARVRIIGFTQLGQRQEVMTFAFSAGLCRGNIRHS